MSLLSVRAAHGRHDSETPARCSQNRINSVLFLKACPCDLPLVHHAGRIIITQPGTSTTVAEEQDMKTRQEWTGRGRGQIAVRLGGVALATAALTLLCGCPWITDAIIYQQSYNEWLAGTEDWPDVAVRIVNDTGGAASVNLVSAGQPPAEPASFGYVGGMEYYSSVETRTVLVDADGTATGTLKCGDVLAIAVKAPFDADAATFGYAYDANDMYGLYLEPGNCALAGAGVAQSGFTGDTFALLRYVRPAEDGLDCATRTLVITIDAAGVPSVVDPDTGEVTVSARLGAATLSIE
jgi:hypothetical protein